MVRPIRSALLDGVAHGFLTREGGVSTGLVAGLNVGRGAGDDGDAVAENRRLAADAVLPGGRLVTVYQVHSPDCVIVTDPWDEQGERPHADALVTDRPGLILGIVTADCAPVLFADRDAGVIGAAHAGWKGAHGGVIESTVAAMVQLGARRDRIVAAIGPCIGQPSYEVGEDFRANFAPEDAQFFIPGKAGHYQFALEHYVERQLRRAGVGTIDPLGLDTYSDPQRFYSYRRATHEGAANYGRQFSLIALAG